MPMAGRPAAGRGSVRVRAGETSAASVSLPAAGAGARAAPAARPGGVRKGGGLIASIWQSGRITRPSAGAAEISAANSGSDRRWRNWLP